MKCPKLLQGSVYVGGDALRLKEDDCEMGFLF